MMAGLINPRSLARERSGQGESAYYVVLRIGGVLNMRIVFGLIIATVVLTGCQTTPVTYDVPRSQIHDRAPAALWPAITQAVEMSGMNITAGHEGPPSLIAARGVDQPGDWAACKRARVIDRHDDKSRRGRGWPMGRMVQLVVDVEKVGDGSKVSLRATFIEEQINPFKNLPFQVRCRSTGVLERSLLDAIGRA